MKPNAEKDATLSRGTSDLVAGKVSLLKSINGKTDPTAVTAAEASNPAMWVECDYSGYAAQSIASTELNASITDGASSGQRKRMFPDTNALLFPALPAAGSTTVVGAVLWESNGGGTLTTTPKRVALLAATTTVTENERPMIDVNGWTSVES